jgi:hypothetical protein
MTVVELPAAVQPVTRWRLATRIAFRCVAVYFTLYVLSTQMIGGLVKWPTGGSPNLSAIPAVRNGVSWVAAHVFGVRNPLVITGSGSGDKTFDWVLVSCLLTITAIAVTVWSIVDRHRPNYITAHKWLHLFLRFALGSTMATYALVKVIPLQMPAPPLTRLLEPFGHFSPMGVLWYSVGASRPYEMFTGFAELAAAVLLFVPATATLGALVALADSIQIFALNMTYDVPVKLFSFQLILLSLILLAPEASRLMNMLVLNRTAGPSTQPSLTRSRRANSILAGVQAAVGVYLLGTNLYGAVLAWTRYGGGAPKSPLYGIWNVDRMSIDGVERSPLTSDYDRFRRVVFQAPTAIAFQRMDDTFTTYTAAIDSAGQSLTLTRPADKNWKADFTFQRPAGDQLVLDGALDGHAIHMRLQLFDREKFLLVSRGFHWVQEYPFNR